MVGRLRLLARSGLGLALVIAVGLGTPSVARAQNGLDYRVINAVEAYLNELEGLRASFVQIGPDGGMATGRLYYRRPDKMRLDYDPPSGIEIVANGWQLVYHDRRLEQVSHLRTGSTPLGFLLDEEIRLGGGVTVTDTARADGEIRLSLLQTSEPDQGEVTLTFAEEPLQLQGWSVTDAQGLTTHILLEEVETGVELADSLFVFRDPYRNPGGRD